MPVVSVPGLRPTPDRVRETLFNWLQFQVPGARCLDLFAGSGALGLEALSREAAEVVFIEQHPAAFAQLQSNLQTLTAHGAVLRHTDAFRYLQHETQPFDVIFLDPPFRQGLAEQALALVIERQLLQTDGLVYLEFEAEAALASLPSVDFARFGLQIRRETRAGQVVSLLLERMPA